MIILNKHTEFNQSYLEYNIQNTDIIDTFCEGMIKNNMIEGLVPLSFQQVNDEKIYSYNITGLISLEEYLRKQMRKNELLHMIINLLDTLEISQDYMIESSYFLLDNCYIFINPINKKIHVIALPIENYAKELDIGFFIKNILMTVNYHPNENTAYVTEILNYINHNPIFTLIEMKSFLQNMDSSYSKPNIPIKSEPIKRVDKPKVIQQPYNPPNIKEKESVRSVPKPVESKKEEFSVGISTSKRKDSIPTLKKSKVISTEKQINTIKKKNSMPVHKKTTIPKKGEPKSSIPTLKKRKAPDVKNDIGPSLNYEVSGKYDRTVTTGDFSGTTVLGLEEGTTVLSEGTTLLTDNEIVRYPKIRRLKTNQIMEITKNVFNIGKDFSFNDFVINDNSAISRKHAEICLVNGTYYITDLHSTNKTYVDGKIVQPGYQIELMSGSLIRIANEDFIFEL